MLSTYMGEINRNLQQALGSINIENPQFLTERKCASFEKNVNSFREGAGYSPPFGPFGRKVGKDFNNFGLKV